MIYEQMIFYILSEMVILDLYLQMVFCSEMFYYLHIYEIRLLLIHFYYLLLIHLDLEVLYHLLLIIMYDLFPLLLVLMYPFQSLNSFYFKIIFIINRFI